ncbi:MAG: hypothetical protein NZ701_01520, partial [Roseiflexus sp.]|nr:hypothetical protein [Roseiflexus sp.]
VFAGNVWIEARQRQPMEAFDRGYVVSVLADNFGNGLSSFFPLYLRDDAQPRDLFAADKDADRIDAGEGRRFNLSRAAVAYLRSISADDKADALFYHIVAVLHAPAYRSENAGALRQDWPRIPLPSTREALLASAELGCTVAELLDSERPVPGVTTDVIDERLRPIAVLSVAGGGQVNLADGDLDVTAGWGYAGRDGIVMPGKGRVIERRAQESEINPALGIKGATLDVYLNKRVYWRNVPPRVWEYTAGGYQVLKKWLSYRKKPVLGRSLTIDEAREVTAIARRIARLLLLSKDLDANYRRVASQ